MDALKKKLRCFNQERDWEQFHTPENLAKSIAIEAGELLECFQWNNHCDKQAVSDEVADVICYCVMLADKLDIDLPKAIEEKIEKNAANILLKSARAVARSMMRYENPIVTIFIIRQYSRFSHRKSWTDLLCSLHYGTNYSSKVHKK